MTSESKEIDEITKILNKITNNPEDTQKLSALLKTENHGTDDEDSS